MADYISRYQRRFPPHVTDLEIEMEMIRRGGTWIENGVTYGKGLAFHYEQMRKCIWPEIDDHRWNQLIVREIRRPNATVTCLMGPKSTGKTFNASWNYLCEYFVFPEETCVLVSSTDIRGLRLRVWGEITSLWQRAVDRFDFLPGHLLDSKLAITTDSLEDGDLNDRRVRDMRKAICGIPCVQHGKFVGLSKYVGIKQKRMRLIADELSAMGPGFLKSFSNLDGNEDFQAVVAFNPNDPTDQGGIAAEPVDGWASHMEPTKTEVWDTKFYQGRCINLVGTDSPNFDYPADQPDRFKYLIGRKKIANTIATYGKDSFEDYSQCRGVMKVSVLSRRVLNRDLARKFHAQEDAKWQGSPTTKIAGLDAAYGGDRCMIACAEFGKSVDGNIIIELNAPVLVPVRVTTKEPMEAEEQIARYCKEYCESNHIPPENFGHDSTGRGSLGTALAREWSNQCVPIEFGGKPTNRPVSLDIYINDTVTKKRRLKLCSEHYSKFVTELWYSVRYAVEADQVRGFPEEALEEFCQRNWELVKDDKRELETKKDMKERIGKSPDAADCIAIVFEMARRRGFQIAKLGTAAVKDTSLDWLKQMQKDRAALVRRDLVHH